MPVTRSTWNAIAFSPGFRSAGRSTAYVVADADGLLGDLRALGDREDSDLAADLRGASQRRLLNSLGIHLDLLDHVRSDGVADGDVLRGDENRLGGCLGCHLGLALVEQDHDGDEGEDGKQNADQDDEAIRSLHGKSPLSSGVDVDE